MSEKVTYLLPIWIDLSHERHKEIMRELNDALTDFFERECEKISDAGCTVNVQWSINQHVNIHGGGS